MFKRIRRYLLFLCVFTFATTNITDLGIIIDEETLETSSPEHSQAVSDGTGEALQDEPEESSQEPEDCDSVICAEEVSLADTSCKTVSDYIHTYQKLPPVYITKKEACELGWIGGNLCEIDSQRSIGGDYFGNYKGILPRKSGRCYRECDIDTLGSESRGAKRIVYSNDGLMYYTEDHYATFTLLYSDWDNANVQYF